MTNLTVHTCYPCIKPTLTSKGTKTAKWHLFVSIANDIKAEAKRLINAQHKRKPSKPDN